jgi:hypothetical protein
MVLSQSRVAKCKTDANSWDLDQLFEVLVRGGRGGGLLLVRSPTHLHPACLTLTLIKSFT